jgi:Ca-activated chloride channel family protein
MMFRQGPKTNVIVTLCLAWVCTAVIRGQEPSSTTANQTLKIDVDRVLVNTTVSDPQGRMVLGLERDAFQLWEDKIEQKIDSFSIEDSPLSIGLLFDSTGSMSAKISTARDAAVTFLKTGNPKDEYFLITFSQNAQLAENFTNDISRLQNRLIFSPAKGSTPLFDAIYMGLDKMKNAGYKRKALLLITDGEDNHSRYSFGDIKEFIKEQDVQLFAIGIVSSFGELSRGRGGQAVIQDLVQLTGGRAFFPESVYELEDICSKIAFELRNQYVLGYHSTNEAKDGKWRKIRLKVNPLSRLPALTVRGKAGYYAHGLETAR